ncbi:MAG: hypothetical protein Q9175_005660, partial [Cornicularia normoerica]
VSTINVIYHFLNDIVVNFSQEAEDYFYYDSQGSLNQASENAVESYFALFHLLLCLAIEKAGTVHTADTTIHSFLAGRTSKYFCLSIGHLVATALISNTCMAEQLRLANPEEAVFRNVIGMLDPTDANMPELAYLEPSAISEYRLRRSFQASKTSYRLLMFLNFFCQTARGRATSLANLCDEIFNAHGAPLRGIANL